MKIRTFKSKQILLLYLLKSKTYEQVIAKNTSNMGVRSSLIDLLVSLKKSLQIIFHYNAKNKLILFVGLPETLKFKINKFTFHIAVSKYSNLQGSLLNIYKKDVSASLCGSALSKISGQKPHLIVLVDHANLDAIVKESHLSKIPLICVNNSYDKKNFFYNNSYNVSISSDLLKPLYNFFFVGLSFLFK